ncbi:hypothetical protein BL07027 [Bacillus licheniformis DSM 13 = ATCC 14580]|uniref:Uncharacterized protein n=1 Tax=Bacillus licheniformis (strain ATCC 14580 / DSM 13 / JCM 2505 / CCUG 7422 / NBRC 12200 / NCIMB 9375 / NCTC 10341 / NRRL NRS-1264 / Gibson 46) TaxID=279010 RepID=Q65KM1_BACLD|nr:hypothetical protein BL07027 [Bacillus licheniformis DSM 13 = ATCC 14580]
MKTLTNVEKERVMLFPYSICIYFRYPKENSCLFFLDIKKKPVFSKWPILNTGFIFPEKIKIFISELRNRHPLQNFPIMLTE